MFEHEQSGHVVGFVIRLSLWRVHWRREEAPSFSRSPVVMVEPLVPPNARVGRSVTIPRRSNAALEAEDGLVVLSSPG